MWDCCSFKIEYFALSEAFQQKLHGRGCRGFTRASVYTCLASSQLQGLISNPIIAYKIFLYLVRMQEAGNCHATTKGTYFLQRYRTLI